MKSFSILLLGLLLGFLASSVLLLLIVKEELVDFAKTEIAPEIMETYKNEITEAGDLLPLVKSEASLLEEKISILLLPESQRTCALLASAEKQYKSVQWLIDIIKQYKILKKHELPESVLELYETSFTEDKIAQCDP